MFLIPFCGIAISSFFGLFFIVAVPLVLLFCIFHMFMHALKLIIEHYHPEVKDDFNWRMYSGFDDWLP